MDKRRRRLIDFCSELRLALFSYITGRTAMLIWNLSFLDSGVARIV